MKKILRTILISLLIFSLIIPSVTAFAEESQPTDVTFAEGVDTPLMGEYSAVSPEQVNNAIAAYAKAIGDLAKDVSDVSTLEAVMTRLGGLTSLAGGGIAVLKMMGIIKDPTTAMLTKILGEIVSIQQSLVVMDQKLDALAQQLIDIAVDQKEIDRQNTARQLLSYWRDFKHNYVEPLQLYAEEYQGIINNALKNWWESESHDGIRVLYTNYKDEIVLTYSRSKYDAGFPTTADNGETVLPESSFGLPAEYMPQTSQTEFHIDTYAEDFRPLLASAFVKAADDGKLEASEAFYEEWNILDSESKLAAAAEYSDDFLSSIIYQISCKTMSTNENNLWVINVMNAYSNYCSNILDTDNGINALLNVQYYTHGFEGEIRDAVLEICDSMVATAGYYGTFALNVASQDSMQSLANKQALQQKWVDTVLQLENKKKTSLTGHDNFCYIAGGLLKYDKLQTRSTVTFCYRDYGYQAFQSFSCSPWTFAKNDGTETSLPTLLNSVSSLVLYHQFLPQRKESEYQVETFLQYLNSHNTGAPDSGQNIVFMTNYVGVQIFALSDGLTMGCSAVTGDYFQTGTNYRINVDNPSKIENQYFPLHDRLMWDYLDPKNGQIHVNQIAAARAAYAENHKYWTIDEMHFFCSNNATFTYTQKDERKTDSELLCTRTYYITKPINILYIDAVKMDDYPQDSPLKAFDQAYMMPVEPDTPSRDFSIADWDNIDLHNLNLYQDESEISDEKVVEQIELEILRAKTEGKEVILSDAEKADLAEQIKAMILTLQAEMEANQSLSYSNAFGINGNEDAVTKLVNAVIPEGIALFDGNTKVMLSNTNVFAKYQPWVALHFTNKDGKMVPVLNPGFFVTPFLAVWGPYEEECNFFEISGEVMQALGLSMDVKLSAVSAGKEKTLTVIHYDNEKDLNRLDTVNADVQGSGSDKFVQLKVTSCSPFELAPLEQTPATGDNRNMALWIILMTGAAVIIAAAVILLAGKRRKIK
ncbi:MAG: hypothetical protein IKF93_03825 [Lachnospiraceae bacterium]|nr:hypothetical protein [Lachnospiraceae bacterium]